MFKVRISLFYLHIITNDIKNKIITPEKFRIGMDL